MLSPKEDRLFVKLGLGHLIGLMSIMSLYDTAVRIAFISDNQTPNAAVDSLRRCVKAISFGTCNRNTPEFDALIELD